MRKLLVLFGAFLLLTCALFGAEKNNDKEVVLFQVIQNGSFEKLNSRTYPPASALILPNSVQYLAEHNPSDQSKKIKAFLGASFYFFYHKTLFPTVLNKWVKTTTLSNPLFILFRNLRL